MKQKAKAAKGQTRKQASAKDLSPKDAMKVKGGVRKAGGTQQE